MPTPLGDTTLVKVIVGKYRTNTRCKKTYNLPKEDFKKYGEYLSEIQKIRVIKKKLPEGIFKLLMDEIYNTTVSTDSLSVSPPSLDSSSLG